MEPADIPDLPISKVKNIIPYEDLPPVSILIPCYKRREFLPLMLLNIMEMDYPKNKLEINILQDGDEDLFISKDELEYFKEQCKCKVNYVFEKGVRRSIGEKRNKLVKMASHKICANMDSDDIYYNTYLRYSVSAMKEHKVGITSSAQMLFLYPQYDYKLTGIRCGQKFQGHEACMVFTKKHWKQMSGFVSRGEQASMGEGVKMIAHNEKQMVNLDIRFLMICCVHNIDEGNTISKERFRDCDIDGGRSAQNMPQVEMLKYILSQNE